MNAAVSGRDLKKLHINPTSLCSIKRYVRGNPLDEKSVLKLQRVVFREKLGAMKECLAY